MYLSRIVLGPVASSRADYWTTFSSLWRVHQEIWRLFSDSADRKRDFLFRLDLVHGAPRILALSARPPSPNDGLWSVETKPFDPKLHHGQRLGFSLRANPVRTREGKRHDVVMDRKVALRATGSAGGPRPSLATIVQEEGEGWLRAREERLGFHSVAVAVESHRTEEFRKRGGAPVRISTLDFRGFLEVSDVERFRHTLEAGIGPAKAFGCGLLLIRPA